MNPHPRANQFAGRQALGTSDCTVRSITREDLPRILARRDSTSTLPQRLRESHHTVARLLATGISQTQVAALTGYSATRVGQLAAAPAMQELISHYRAQVDQTFLAATDAFYTLATGNMIAAERHLADRIADLDDSGELLSVREALAISRDAADRFGYEKRKTAINVNADFAALLEKRIAASGVTIDGSVSSLPTSTAAPSAPGALSPPDRAPGAPTLRRLA